MTSGFLSEDERPTNLRRGLTWVQGTNIAQCQWQYPLIMLLHRAVFCPFVTFANPQQEPLKRGVPLDYISCSFSVIQLSHARQQMLMQEDSKMAEFIDRMSQVSLRKT